MIRNALVAMICLTVLDLTVTMRLHADTLSHPVLGPKLLCFKYSTFSLLSGERVTDFSGGLEGMSIQVVGDKGTFDISESEIFRQPKYTGHPVLQQNGTTAYRINGMEPHYDIYGRTSFSNDKDRLMITLSGPSLRGTATDKNIIRRFEIRDPSSAPCQQTFTYSFF